MAIEPPAAPLFERPDSAWEYRTLYDNVLKTLYALPSFFKTDLLISGVLATDLFTFNSSLGATIEAQVVEALNAVRGSWDPDQTYASYSFARQSQRFPDVILRTAADLEPKILMGIELKGWYALAKEREPSFRYKASPNVCAPIYWSSTRGSFPMLSAVRPSFISRLSQGRGMPPNIGTIGGGTSRKAEKETRFACHLSVTFTLQNHSRSAMSRCMTTAATLAASHEPALWMTTGIGFSRSSFPAFRSPPGKSFCLPSAKTKPRRRSAAPLTRLSRKPLGQKNLCRRESKPQRVY